MSEEVDDGTASQPRPAVTGEPYVQDELINELIETCGRDDQFVMGIVADIEERKQFGIAKYGTALQRGNGRDHLQDAYEEALDLVIYMTADGNMAGTRDLALEVLFDLKQAINAR